MLILYKNYSSSNSNYIELLLKQPLSMTPLYKSECGVRPIRHLLALTMNCNDASKPIYIVRYNPVHPKEKQTMIYFRTPETVCPLQIGYTNHNYPFYSPTTSDFVTPIIPQAPCRGNEGANAFRGETLRSLLQILLIKFKTPVPAKAGPGVLVCPTGFEPATFGVGVIRHIRQKWRGHAVFGFFRFFAPFYRQSRKSLRQKDFRLFAVFAKQVSNSGQLRKTFAVYHGHTRPIPLFQADHLLRRSPQK